MMALNRVGDVYLASECSITNDPRVFEHTKYEQLYTNCTSTPLDCRANSEGNVFFTNACKSLNGDANMHTSSSGFL